VLFDRSNGRDEAKPLWDVARMTPATTLINTYPDLSTIARAKLAVADSG